MQFHDGYAQDDLTFDLAALAPGNPVSVYIHIPFCHSLCHYCGCHTKIVRSTAPVSAYVENLCAEIRLAASAAGRKISVARVHFGGGSPNFAPVQDLAKILATLRACFDLSSDLEVDMECDPRLLDESKIKAYVAMGVNRMSLGIQDFDATVQKAINRIQPFEKVRSQVESIRQAGIEGVNFDLIIGLPEQTLESVQKTLSHVKTLQPDRIAVFAYAHVPWMKKHQMLLEKYTMPDSSLRFEMAMAVRAELQDAGYLAIGIDHFARPHDTLAAALREGHMRRNFQGYTDDPSETILGFGLSAISQFKSAYAQNTLDAPTYRRMVEGGSLPVVRGLRLSAEDERRRALINEIMCRFSVDLADYADIAVPSERLAMLQQDGLITLDRGLLSVTPAGVPFVRVVASSFDPYFKATQNRHAKAV